ncbi:DNA methylase [Ligilactobacillus pabuli]|uniref:DNA methylase n=1 Tax=Ligilactobacillus pabuli TaxID=2886039 RepID=A0ABQ5JL10_9LACO|nr:DNA repair protein RadC [Ligilactobacillus pabuli]GKS81917.1 DNA methylase [Ligilactobacillus pabuli]
MTLINSFDLDYLTKQIQHYGPQALTDRELLFCVCCSAFPKRTASKITGEFFDQYEDLEQMQYLTNTEIRALLPTEQKAWFFEVLGEFANRYEKRPALALGTVYSSRKIGEYMTKMYGAAKQELLVGIYLDTKNQVMLQKNLFKGTLNSATVHPREIFREAVKCSAARFMVVHNHPSGNVTPSKNDLALTKRLVSCGEMLGITLLDHIIVGDSSYLSMREEEIIA